MTALERYDAWIETTMRILLRHLVIADDVVARRIASPANDR